MPVTTLAIEDILLANKKSISNLNGLDVDR